MDDETFEAVKYLFLDEISGEVLITMLSKTVSDSQVYMDFS